MIWTYELGNYETRVIKLTEEDTKLLNEQGWVYNHDDDILILQSKDDGTLSVFTNIAMKVPDYDFEIRLNCKKDEC